MTTDDPLVWLREIERKATPGPWMAASAPSFANNVPVIKRPEGWVVATGCQGADNARAVAVTRNILAALIDVAEAVKPDGCGDHGCIIKRPVGLGTNAGCRCRRELARTRAALDAAIRKEMDRE